jgi:flagellar biosynthesis/type III secretory pathway M-ring protein FliF/YscJ
MEKFQDKLDPVQQKTRIYLVGAFFTLVAIFLIGLFWLASTPGQTVGLTLSFAAGLLPETGSMRWS